MDNNFGQGYGATPNMNQNQGYNMAYGNTYAQPAQPAQPVQPTQPMEAKVEEPSFGNNNASMDFNFGGNQNVANESYQWGDAAQQFQPQQNVQQVQQTQGYGNVGGNYVEDNRKDRFIAGVFALFFGVYGIHNFYLGYKKKAYWQLGLCLGGMVLSCIFIGVFAILAAYVWAIIDAVNLFTGKINVDANGLPLKR